MKKVLVTGSSGQLGRELQNVARGEAAQGFSWLFTDMQELDVSDEGAVVHFFEAETPDVVINCAAWTDVDGAETNPEDAHRINAYAPHLLAGVVKLSGALLIHISTDFVFDGLKQTPYTEDDLAAPLNVYGQSKLAGEQAVIGSGCNGAILRTSWLYSPYGRNFVKTILGAASRNSEISVVADQWGCPTAADGLAEAIVQIIHRLAAEPRAATIYNYCDAGVVNRSGFAGEIIRQAGLDCVVVPVASEEYPSSAARPAYSALDTAKIEHDFGIVPRRWQDALAEVLARI